MLSWWAMAVQYPKLYNIVQQKMFMLLQALLNIGFWRAFTGVKWAGRLYLVNRLMTANLTQEHDVFRWKLHTSGVFSIKSMYSDLVNDGEPFHHRFFWKLKVPLKIKIVMWYLHRRVILTKDYVKKHEWHGCTKCCFLGGQFSILFLQGPLTKLLWCSTHVASNLPPLINCTNMFENWLIGIHPMLKAQIRMGVYASLWSIWKCRNNCVFNPRTVPKNIANHCQG